jgi:hypothetical protein
LHELPELSPLFGNISMKFGIDRLLQEPELRKPLQGLLVALLEPSYLMARSFTSGKIRL